MTTTDILSKAVTTKTTEELLAISDILQGKQDEAGRAVRGAVIDEITTRLGISDLVEEIYMNLDYEGTSHEAILAAMVRIAA